jgi:hypothetical protein
LIYTVKMHLPSSLLFLASVPLALAAKGKGNGPKTGLDALAKRAGLKYFGAATDSPGQRERAPYPESYAQYDEIMWSGEFGQTTPTNGQKVGADSSHSLTLMLMLSVAVHRARAGPVQLH